MSQVQDAEKAERAVEAGVDVLESGDYSEAFIYAGQAAGLVHDLLPAGELVERLAAEDEERLGACRSLLFGEGS